MTHSYDSFERVPRVTAYRNGDINTPGKKIVINRRRLRDMDALFKEFGVRTNCNGVVRRICTPLGRHECLGFEDFKDGGSYVAVGCEKFKRLNYGELPLQKKNEKSNVPMFPKLEDSVKNGKSANTVGRIKNATDSEIFALRVIYIHRNGDDRFAPRRMLLKKGMMSDMENVLKWIQEKIMFTTVVHGLYTLEGKQVVDIDEIKNAGTYVAVERSQKFKYVAYKNSNYKNDIIRRNRPSRLPPIENNELRKKRRRKKVQFVYNPGGAIAESELDSESGINSNTSRSDQSSSLQDDVYHNTDHEDNDQFDIHEEEEYPINVQDDNDQIDVQKEDGYNTDAQNDNDQIKGDEYPSNDQDNNDQIDIQKEDEYPSNDQNNNDQIDIQKEDEYPSNDQDNRNMSDFQEEGQHTSNEKENNDQFDSEQTDTMAQHQDSSENLEIVKALSPTANLGEDNADESEHIDKEPTSVKETQQKSVEDSEQKEEDESTSQDENNHNEKETIEAEESQEKPAETPEVYRQPSSTDIVQQDELDQTADQGEGDKMDEELTTGAVEKPETLRQVSATGSIEQNEIEIAYDNSKDANQDDEGSLDELESSISENELKEDTELGIDEESVEERLLDEEVARITNQETDETDEDENGCPEKLVEKTEDESLHQDEDEETINKEEKVNEELSSEKHIDNVQNESEEEGEECKPEEQTKIENEATEKEPNADAGDDLEESLNKEAKEQVEP